MELDIAGNLSCYEYDAVILSAADYGEYILEEAGIHTKDPAFSGFDFEGFGERQLRRSGFVETPYGIIGGMKSPSCRSIPKQSLACPCSKTGEGQRI